MAPKATLDDPVLGPLTDDLLTVDYPVFQRAKGHRFSSDDVVTAFVAHQEAPGADRIVDLGCGLGSVLLTLAWKMPHASLVGIEAQDASFELLRRNVARNDLASRVAIHHGDLRDEALIARLGGVVPLVTGTPPYFPPGTALDAADAQRAYARMEYRGGVEAYLRTGKKLMAPGGVLVLCGDARADARVVTEASALGLHVTRRTEIVAQEGKPALFTVWSLRTTHDAGTALSSITLRTRDGRRTADADALRSFSGFAPVPPASKAR